MRMRTAAWAAGLAILLTAATASAQSHGYVVDPDQTTVNWSQLTDGEGSSGWNTLTGDPRYPTENAFIETAGTNATVTLNIDVTDASFSMWNFASGQQHWIVNTSDTENNKLTFDRRTTGTGWRRIFVRATNQSFTFNVPIILDGTGTILFNLAGGGNTSTAATRIHFNAPIEGVTGLAWFHVSTVYTGGVALNAANTYLGNTRWYSGARSAPLRIGHNLALQNSTLDVGLYTIDENEDTRFHGRTEFHGTAPGADPDAPFVLGGLIGSRNVPMDGKTLHIGNNNADTAYEGGLSDGAVEKIGTGTLTLSGQSTYTGTTRVSAGTLKLSGDGSIATSERIEVVGTGLLHVADVTGGFALASGQTLAGTGWTTGGVRVGSGATLAPGSSIGTLNFADGVTLADGAIIEWEFQDTTAYDRIVADALVLENGAEITIKIRNPGAIDIEEGDRFTLYDGDVFGYAGATFKLQNESDWAGGFDIEEGSLVLVAIPEPGVLLTSLLGAALLRAASRRRRAVGR